MQPQTVTLVACKLLALPSCDMILPSQQGTELGTTPGGGGISGIHNLPPLVGLIAGVQGPSIPQRHLPIIAAHGDQEAIGNHGQHMRIPGTGARAGYHHSATTVHISNSTRAHTTAGLV